MCPHQHINKKGKKSDRWQKQRQACQGYPGLYLKFQDSKGYVRWPLGSWENLVRRPDGVKDILVSALYLGSRVKVDEDILVGLGRYGKGSRAGLGRMQNS